MRRLLFSALALVACDAAPTDKTASASKAPTTPTAAITSTPLPDRAAPKGPRFERIDAKAAGIDFVHTFKAPKGREAEFAGPFAGGGVALGDYDGDGKVDVCLTRQIGGARLYRNLGDFNFEDVTAKAGIDAAGWTTAPGFIDLDGDGDLDLLIGQFDAPLLAFINEGGRFTEKAAALGLDQPAATSGLAFADYDRDGDLDLYQLTYRRTPTENLEGNPVRENGKLMPPKEHREYLALLIKPGVGPVVVNAGQRDRLLRNDNGRFTDVTEVVGLGVHYEMGLSARFWDFDADGWQDLYIANDFFGADRLYRNTGGRFVEVTREALPHTPWFSMGADAGDIDNDGRLDFFAADMAGTNHFKQKLSMGDMDDDGWFLEHPEPRQYMRNAVYLNTGTPRFMEIAKLTGLASTDWTWTPRFVDLDEDGRLDLFVTNGMTRDYSDSDVRLILKLERNWQSFNYERWKQQPPRAEPNLAFKNLGDLEFQKIGKDWGLGGDTVSFGAAFGDLDGDGDPDLVINDFEAPPRIYRNHAHGTARITVRLVDTQNTWGVGAQITATAGDLTVTRDLAASGGFFSANDLTAHLGLGDATQVDLRIRWPNGKTRLIKGLKTNHAYVIRPTAGEDAPGDAWPEPLYTALPDLGRHQDRPFDDFKIQPLLPNRVSAQGPGMAWADLTGDGKPEMFLSGGSGSPPLLAGKLFPGDPRIDQQGAVFFDVDGDGDLDLYSVSGSVEQRPGAPTYQDVLYLNEGGTWKITPAPVTDSGGAVLAADYDGDGDVDLFVGGRVVPGAWPSAPNSRILRNDKGTLTEVTDQIAPGLRAAGMVTSGLWTDADNDGKLDLMLTYEWGPVRWWRNTGAGFVDQTAAAGLDAQTGWFNSISAGDVDNDGDLDYLVGNTGLNTKYHPSHQKPAIVWYGPFGADGSHHIVEGKYERDVLYPVRGRSCSSDAMPELAQRYGTFTAFAKASAADIYGDKLETAQRFEVDTLDSGVLINDGKGGFGFRPLPRWVQASPIFGSALTDVDGDGDLDAVVAQNFYWPQRETGRFAGGVSAVLLGDSKGGFAPVDPAQSGLVVPGDARALTLAHLDDDGCPEVTIATNNGPVHAFKPRCATPPYRVRLKGAKGDPGGFGARITAHLKDGSTRIAEVHAGSGYLGQSQVGEVFGLPGGLDLDRIVVRWADGRTTTVPAKPGGVTVER